MGVGVGVGGAVGWRVCGSARARVCVHVCVVCARVCVCARARSRQGRELGVC